MIQKFNRQGIKDWKKKNISYKRREIKTEGYFIKAGTLYRNQTN